MDCLQLCEQKIAGVLKKPMNYSNFLSLLLLLPCTCTSVSLPAMMGEPSDQPC